MAGSLYLSLLPFGVYSFVYVPSVLFVPGDAAATSRNIMASEWLFRSGMMSHVISQVLVVFLALTMYRLLRDVHNNHAVVMVVMALVCIPISVFAEVHNLAVLRLLSYANDGSLPSAEAQVQTMFFLDIHRSGVLLAQVFWGLWLVLLGSLVFRSGFLPRWLGIAVLMAAVGYLIDSSAHVLLPGRAAVSQFTAIGELLFPLWLLIKGVDVERWSSRAARLDSA